MSNRLRHYRRHMIRSAAEANGGKLFARGAGRKVADEPSRLSAAYHAAMKSKHTYSAPKRGLDARKPTQSTAKKTGISDMLKNAIRRKLAQ